MGTRGAYGFRLLGKDYVTYNHFDSYPKELGESLVYEVYGFMLQRSSYLQAIADMKGFVEEIELLEQDDALYQELRQNQGSINPIIHGTDKRMIDNQSFLRDSLFCEWAYIVNLDEEVFEVYRGFNKYPANPGRYARTEPDERGFVGVKLVRTYKLEDLLVNTDKVLIDLHVLEELTQ